MDVVYSGELELVTVLRIGANSVSVYQAPELEGEFGAFEADIDTGYRILVRPKISTRLGSQVLLHEIIHAINDAYGLQDDESLTRVWEQALAGFILDNPDIVRALTSTLK